MSESKKILVIGASIAGPAICYWLKQFGYLPTLIEKNKHLRKGGFAIDVRGIAIDVVKKMDIYERICDMRTQIETGRYVDAEGNTLYEDHGEKLGVRQGEEVEIVRGDLVDILMQLIKDVPCHFNQTVQSIKQHENNVEVYFKDGKTEYFDLIIGADGLHSSTRRMIFSNDEVKLSDLGLYISVFTTQNFLHLHHSEVLFEINQKLATMSSDSDPNKALAGFMFRSNHRLNDIRDENEQKKFLRDIFQNLGWEVNQLLDLMDLNDELYFDSITQVKMSTWTKGRVALVGDAGYCASPLSGQGTSLALVGAYILACELKAAKGDYSRAFHRYNMLLRPFVDANQAFGVWVSKTFLANAEMERGESAKRHDAMLEKMQTAANAITLPVYGV